MDGRRFKVEAGDRRHERILLVVEVVDSAPSFITCCSALRQYIQSRHTAQAISTMAKKQKSSAAATAAPAASAVTAKADIDNIFAKPSASAAQPTTVDQTSKDPTSVESSKIKKKKKKVAPAEVVEDTPQPTSATKSTKRKADTTQPESVNPDTSAPEVAVFSDPSAAAISTKKQKTAVVPGKGKSREQMMQEDEEERAFRDSRGDGPREFTFLTGCLVIGSSSQSICERSSLEERACESRTVTSTFASSRSPSAKSSLLGLLARGFCSSTITPACDAMYQR